MQVAGQDRRAPRPGVLAGSLVPACLALCLSLGPAGPAGAAESAAVQSPAQGPALAALATVPPAGGIADWLSAAPAPSFPLHPADGAVVQQSPPGFTWPDLAPDGRYLFRLTGPDGAVEERQIAGNVLLLDHVLPAGRYDWQLRIDGDTARGWSDRRRFQVAEGATPFPVPALETLWDRAVSAPHPRLLPSGEAWQRHRADLLSGRRGPVFARAQQAAMAAIGQYFSPDPGAAAGPPADSAEPGWWPQPGEDAYRTELETLERAAFVWRVTGEPALLEDTRTRLMKILDWPVDGATAFFRNDALARNHAWSLSFAYDMMHDVLSPAVRSRIAATVAAGMMPAYRWFLDNPDQRQATLQAQPWNSHGNSHLVNLAALSVMFAGELPQARAWFDRALPLHLALPHPWGGEDGGSGIGGNYAFYTMINLLRRWGALRHGIGLDPADTAWARNFPLYAAYFQGPGMPFLFGDGAGHRDTRLTGTVMRTLYAHTGSKVARWYALQVPYSYPVPHIIELLAPPSPAAADKGPDPARLPDAAVLPSIGWAALHSDLQAPQKASVYFRSGPFGSDGHNDADQNSFILDIDRQRLAIDSGYYDSYDSPHMMHWSRQTRAHNAITFDGGKGQPARRLDTAGRITAFSDSGRLASVTGDATNAYDGALGEAVRTLAFLRPDLVLVYDRLSSPTPRRFEWNLHSLGEMLPYARNALGFSQRNTTLCVEILAPPGLDLDRTDRFGSPDRPPDRSDLPRQWHARFATTGKTAGIEFLALLRLRCASTPVSGLARQPGGGFILDLGNNRLAIGPQGALLNPPTGK